jgi:type I restriction enzyme S subunit
MIKNISFNAPAYQEQIKIANFLSAIDDKIQNTKAQLEAAKQFKQGLLQQMFV